MRCAVILRRLAFFVIVTTAPLTPVDASAENLVDVRGVETPFCVDTDGITTDYKMFTYARMAVWNCKTVSNGREVLLADAVAFDCDAVFDARRLPDGGLATRYFWRQSDDAPWQEERHIEPDMVPLAGFVCNRRRGDPTIAFRTDRRCQAAQAETQAASRASATSSSTAL